MIIKRPTKTEKSLQSIERDNTMRFIVDDKATKKEIAAEVEKLFTVKVAAVRTLISSRGKKHAFVRLAKGYKADELATKLKMIT
ncbi:MAG: 50S ribosomal protein L23 [Candidatus Micrarchaeota archaeon]